jgi:hypothetical protein
VVRDADDADITGAPQPDVALAVLDGLDGVGRRQRARRLGQRAELLLDVGKRGRLVELAGDQEDGVVGLVVLLIECVQRARRDALDIRARADRRLAVVVPEVRGRQDPLVQDAAGVVLAGLELVAHDRHLALQIALEDRRIHHPIGLEVDRPVDVLLRRGKRLEVVRAIERSGRVVLRAARVHQLRQVAQALGALEHHVLEEVRHAGLAVALVPRADEVRDVDGHGRLRRVGEQQHREPVVEAVLGDALDRADLRRLRRLRHRRHDGRHRCHRDHLRHRPRRRRRYRRLGLRTTTGGQRKQNGQGVTHPRR